MPTITLPDFWIMFTPEGKADGSMIAVRNDGSICCATAEDAWAQFTPRKRDREREARQGWQVLGIAQADWQDYWSGRRKPEPTA